MSKDKTITGAELPPAKQEELRKRLQRALVDKITASLKKNPPNVDIGKFKIILGPNDTPEKFNLDNATFTPTGGCETCSGVCETCSSVCSGIIDP